MGVSGPAGASPAFPLHQDNWSGAPQASARPLHQDTCPGTPEATALSQQPKGAAQGTRKGYKHYHTRVYLPDGPEKQQRRRLLNNEATNRRNKKKQQQQQELEQQLQKLQQENTRRRAVQQLLPRINRRLLQMLTDQMASHQASALQ